MIAIDRKESPALLEPLLPAEESPHYAALASRVLSIREVSHDLAQRLEECGEALRSRLTTQSFEREIRASWALEGEVAEAAVIWIARRGLEGLGDVHWPSAESLVALHAQIFPQASGMRCVDVSVGRHVAPSPGALPRLLGHMERSYRRPGLISRVVGIAAGHHRLSWCHPFVDGNGRAARLLARHQLGRTLPAADTWSLSEILLERRDDYLRLMALADEPRRGDRDGRGNLSEARLASLVGFFLDAFEEGAERASCALRKG